ncbi:MAG: polyhydroxyalkanoic acid system family protein [Novosphingobium sp.]
MRVPIPHSLGKEEARRRLHARSGDLAGMMPGGMADVQVTWPSEDRMALAVTAMGSSVNAAVEVGESQVVVDVDLPGALKFFEPLVRGAVEQNARKLLK